MYTRLIFHLNHGSYRMLRDLGILRHAHINNKMNAVLKRKGGAHLLSEWSSGSVGTV